VRLGENDVKNVEDLAGLTPDDLRGWYETRDGERVREPGFLDGMEVDAAEAEALIMRGRVAAGWIEADALEPEAEEVEDGADEDAEVTDAELDDLDLSDLEAEAARLGVDLNELLGEDAGAEASDEDEADGEEDDAKS